MYSWKHGPIQSPTLHSLHSYLILVLFFDFLVVWLQIWHLLCFNFSTIDDIKWLPTSLLWKSAVGFPWANFHVQILYCINLKEESSMLFLLIYLYKSIKFLCCVNLLCCFSAMLVIDIDINIVIGIVIDIVNVTSQKNNN